MRTLRILRNIAVLFVLVMAWPALHPKVSRAKTDKYVCVYPEKSDSTAASIRPESALRPNARKGRSARTNRVNRFPTSTARKVAASDAHRKVRIQAPPQEQL